MLKQVFSQKCFRSAISINQAPLQQNRSLVWILSVRWSRSQLANDCNFIDKLSAFGKFIHRFAIWRRRREKPCAIVQQWLSHMSRLAAFWNARLETFELLPWIRNDVPRTARVCFLAICSRFMWRLDFLIPRPRDKIKRGCRRICQLNAHFHRSFQPRPSDACEQWLKNYRKLKTKKLKASALETKMVEIPASRQWITIRVVSVRDFRCF